MDPNLEATPLPLEIVAEIPESLKDAHLWLAGHESNQSLVRLEVPPKALGGLKQWLVRNQLWPSPKSLAMASNCLLGLAVVFLLWSTSLLIRVVALDRHSQDMNRPMAYFIGRITESHQTMNRYPANLSEITEVLGAPKGELVLEEYHPRPLVGSRAGQDGYTVMLRSRRNPAVRCFALVKPSRKEPYQDCSLYDYPAGTFFMLEVMDP